MKSVAAAVVVVAAAATKDGILDPTSDPIAVHLVVVHGSLNLTRDLDRAL